ncbi:uncharacterized protein LOC119281702 isoform X2 [Triticum dicoccoides]|uniref:uncharacterized protein LOC119281702 isoform X2 n=1 Tax=Triticum dicoccoides TaxID=85692 RepID=UPI00188E216F|nr:uncharacterized protein LOC119281702 isoform X2 [Triticum dicoccoides]
MAALATDGGTGSSRQVRCPNHVRQCVLSGKLATQPTLDLVEADGKCRVGGAVDVFAPLQLNLNTLCDTSSLSPPDSEQSTSKDDPQAPGWTRRQKLCDAGCLLDRLLRLVRVEFVALRRQSGG